MTIGNRIRELRIKSDMTQDELAKLVGYKSRSSINKIEIGERDITQSTIVAFAKALKTTPSALMGWEEEPPLESNTELLPNDKIRMIPIFESVSAGFGAYACSDIVDYIPLYIANDYDAKDTICIKVRGNSMYPKIEDGDMVVVRKQSSVDSGQVAVVLVDGDEGLVKKVVYDKNTIELHSFNPEYQTKVFEGREVLRVSVVGLVKQVIKNL